MHLLDAHEVHDVGCPLERLCQDLGPASQVAEVGDQSRTAATVSLLQAATDLRLYDGESCHPPKKKSPVEMGKIHLEFWHVLVFPISGQNHWAFGPPKFAAVLTSNPALHAPQDQVRSHEEFGFTGGHR